MAEESFINYGFADRGRIYDLVSLLRMGYNFLYYETPPPHNNRSRGAGWVCYDAATRTG